MTSVNAVPVRLVTSISATDEADGTPVKRTTVPAGTSAPALSRTSTVSGAIGLAVTVSVVPNPLTNRMPGGDWFGADASWQLAVAMRMAAARVKRRRMGPR